MNEEFKCYSPLLCTFWPDNGSYVLKYATLCVKGDAGFVTELVMWTVYCFITELVVWTALLFCNRTSFVDCFIVLYSIYITLLHLIL